MFVFINNGDVLQARLEFIFPVEITIKSICTVRPTGTTSTVCAAQNVNSRVRNTRGCAMGFPKDMEASTLHVCPSVESTTPGSAGNW
jgi:hypothetical protein